MLMKQIKLKSNICSSHIVNKGSVLLVFKTISQFSKEIADNSDEQVKF